jgi:tRNA(fMet)-specific endonuclease VapC
LVCLDSDFLIDLSKKRANAISKMEELKSKREPIYTTAINAAELYRGTHGSQNKEQAINACKQFLQSFSLLTLEHQSAELWAKLSHDLKSNTISPLDLMIASIAIVNKQVLLTRNLDHFKRVDGLKIESY